MKDSKTAVFITCDQHQTEITLMLMQTSPLRTNEIKSYVVNGKQHSSFSVEMD